VSISYHVVLPTEEVLESARQMGYQFEAPCTPSRYPSAREVRAILDALEGCRVRYMVGTSWWEARVEELDRTRGISYSDIVGGPFASDEDAPLQLSFDKGNPDLHLRILARLTVYCGPLLLWPTDGTPLLVLPDRVVLPPGTTDWAPWYAGQLFHKEGRPKGSSR
jgi:hypothetical protein